MLTKPALSPAKSAIQINKILEVFHGAHGSDRFPLDIDRVAFEAHEIFNFSDPITNIKSAVIDNFEGMLASNDRRTKWMIAYNSALSSEGRIRFTKAHELGHYVLHRHLRDQFMCHKDDMLDWQKKNIESEADIFASYLLMPLDDFRSQENGDINLDLFSHCANRYGVSLTAAILKWISYTDEKAVLIMSNDGFINWASSSDAAFNSGAYFKTKGNVIAIPDSSLTANESIPTCLNGEKIPAKRWFKHADSDANLTEMKLYSAQYDSVLTLLLLPKYTDYWQEKN